MKMTEKKSNKVVVWVLSVLVIIFWWALVATLICNNSSNKVDKAYSLLWQYTDYANKELSEPEIDILWGNDIEVIKENTNYSFESEYNASKVFKIDSSLIEDTDVNDNRFVVLDFENADRVLEIIPYLYNWKNLISTDLVWADNALIIGKDYSTYILTQNSLLSSDTINYLMEQYPESNIISLPKLDSSYDYLLKVTVPAPKDSWNIKMNVKVLNINGK